MVMEIRICTYEYGLYVPTIRHVHVEHLWRYLSEMCIAFDMFFLMHVPVSKCLSTPALRRPVLIRERHLDFMCFATSINKVLCPTGDATPALPRRKCSKQRRPKHTQSILCNYCAPERRSLSDHSELFSERTRSFFRTWQSCPGTQRQRRCRQARAEATTTFGICG